MARFETLALDGEDIQEHFFDKGWTDGLPVVSPTPDRVEAMLAAATMDPATVLGSVPERGLIVPAAPVAANAVMAGCTPIMFPIVAAAVRAVLDPAFNAHVVLASTGGAAMCAVVSGPMAAAVGMNSGSGALGSGNRANATIGRALRLVAINALGARPGEMDAASLGHPGKYAYCFAEDTSDDRWIPLHRWLGHGEADTTVTVFPAEGPRQVANHLNSTAEGILQTAAAAMRNPATYAVGKGGHEVLLVVGPEHASVMMDQGFNREAIGRFLVEKTRISPAELNAAGVLAGEIGSAHDQTPDDDGLLTTIAEPADVWVVRAGGPGSGWSAYIPTFFPKKNGRSVTRVVEAADG